jgi:hypothetical protein
MEEDEDDEDGGGGSNAPPPRTRTPGRRVRIAKTKHHVPCV